MTTIPQLRTLLADSEICLPVRRVDHELYDSDGYSFWSEVRSDRPDLTNQVARCAEQDDAELIAEMLNALPALLDEIEAARGAFEQIEFLATNHGGWFEQDPFGEYAKLGDIASNARAALNSAVGGEG